MYKKHTDYFMTWFKRCKTKQKRDSKEKYFTIVISTNRHHHEEQQGKFKLKIRTWHLLTSWN